MVSIAVIIAAVLLQVSFNRRQRLIMQIAQNLRLTRKRLWRRHVRSNRHVAPGYGVAVAGIKRLYRTSRITYRYGHVRTDQTWFAAVVHKNEQEFDALHAIVEKEINGPLDPYNSLTQLERSSKRKVRKKLSSKELLFLYLEMLSGGSSGTDTITSMSNKYGLSNATIWNYIYHTGWACFRALTAHAPITWPTPMERAAMTGLLRGFPTAVMFVDGTRQPIFKSGDEDKQNDQYFGKDRVHCYAVLIYVDVYGLIRRVEVSYSGRLHDKTMFQHSDVYLNRDKYFSAGEMMICDAGFVGAGDTNWIIVPFKKGTGMYFELRKEWNKDVRQRFCNEMSIGYIKNRSRAFIGRWPFAEELFTASILVAAMIMNWKLEQSDRQIIPIDSMIRNMSDAERLTFIGG